MTRTIRPDGPPRILIADDTGLTFSGNYQRGWPQGFESIGCDVQVCDISALRGFGTLMGQPHSVYRMAKSVSPKLMGKNMANRKGGWKPDLVWFHHGRNGSHPSLLASLHEHGAQTAVYLCDEPYETGETVHYARAFTHIFTMDACTVRAHKTAGHDRSKVWYLPPGAEVPFFSNQKPFAERTIPAYFLGNATLTPRPAYLRPIEQVVKGAEIKFWKPMAKKSPGWVDLKDHPEVFNNTRVGLNVHRDPRITLDCLQKRVRGRPKNSFKHPILQLQENPTGYGTGFWNDYDLPASHWAPRFMDMGACGVCVVNDGFRSEIEREFDFVPQADNPEHFAELVLYYVTHPKEAEEIGCATAEKIRRSHTYSHRAAEVLIRAGLWDRLPQRGLSSLGEPQAFLTPQDSRLLSLRSSSEPTGRSDGWSPVSGSALTEMSTRPSVTNSTDVSGLSQW
jgi:hypothetical protein